MLLKLAWRNIWRNARRSMIVLASMVIGIVAILLYDSLSVGMMHQMLDNQIGANVGHIQIHKSGFNDNKIIQSTIPEPLKVLASLENNSAVKHFSQRVITFGIVSTAGNSSSSNLIGIDPEKEQHVTSIKAAIIEGEYLSGKAHEIVIGKQMAEKLEVELGDKVVGMASEIDGNIGSDVFRVVGIYKTFNSEFDKFNTFIALKNAQKMLNIGENISEIAIILREKNIHAQTQSALKKALGDGYEIFTYEDLLPLIVMQINVYKEAVFIFYAIVGIAMIFGIINTMLMSVFERIQEFGVLMAIGMKNRGLFKMILLEAAVLGFFGTLIGVGIGWLIYIPLSTSGIDLGTFSEALNTIGVGTVIYPSLSTQGMISATLIAPIFAVLGAIYPALKAVRLTPVTAINYI